MTWFFMAQFKNARTVFFWCPGWVACQISISA